MKNRTLTYPLWLLTCMLVLMLAACSSSDGGELGGGTERQSAKLAIYVYAPEQASAHTRADEGEVDPVNNTANEGIIKSLKLWIYETETGNKVGYFNTEDVEALNEGQGATYQIPVSDEFAANKPEVDVYVMANVTESNCGVGTLNENTSRADLIEGAKISGHFGLGDRVKSVPADGLPFAGKLTTQSVVGDAPALRVGTEAEPSTVELTRAVSKLRFVFSKATGSPEVRITGIKIDAEMIPNEEYLFKAPETVIYNASESELLSSAIADVAETADPLVYSYDSQDAQDYEDLINGAASKQPDPEVTVYGPIYLRESDKKLTGTITYSLDGGSEQSQPFEMNLAGDFKRNHTWIVYAYYAGSGDLKVQTIYVKNWKGREVNRDFYNW
ncbi:MAG: hypothetical protein IJ914_09725 [Prevotella sp.]|nr:hypothetical protein [Prevotella sp.]